MSAARLIPLTAAAPVLRSRAAAAHRIPLSGPRRPCSLSRDRLCLPAVDHACVRASLHSNPARR
jgi:hypothetical protein